MFSAERRSSPLLTHNLAELVVRSGALQEGDFTFSSGIKSPVKIESDILRRPENFQIHRDLSECMFIMAHELDLKPDVIVGVIRGGVSFAKDLSGFFDRPFSARLGAKHDPAREREVRGFVPEGSNVLVVEDVVTFGTNSIPCVLDLRRDKVNVLGVMSVYSYGFPQTSENLQRYDILHWSLLYFQDVIHALRRNGRPVEHLEKWYASATDEYERLKNTRPLHV